MTNRIRSAMMIGVLGATLGLGATACEQREPTLGEKMKEAGEEIKDEAKDAADEVKDEIDDAT